MGTSLSDGHFDCTDRGHIPLAPDIRAIFSALMSAVVEMV
jgi:hypothetical protein